MQFVEDVEDIKQLYIEKMGVLFNKNIFGNIII